MAVDNNTKYVSVRRLNKFWNDPDNGAKQWIEGYVSEHAVLYTPQDLTDAQKAQARNNIGARNDDVVIELSDSSKGVHFAPEDSQILISVYASTKIQETYLIVGDAEGWDVSNTQVTRISGGSDNPLVSFYYAQAFAQGGKFLIRSNIDDEVIELRFIGLRPLPTITQYTGELPPGSEEIEPKDIGGSSDTVRYDVVQTLTDAQKEQARSNIGSASAGDLPWSRTIVPDPEENFPVIVIWINGGCILAVDSVGDNSFHGLLNISDVMDITAASFVGGGGIDTNMDVKIGYDDSDPARKFVCIGYTNDQPVVITCLAGTAPNRADSNDVSPIESVSDSVSWTELGASPVKTYIGSQQSNIWYLSRDDYDNMILDINNNKIVYIKDNFNRIEMIGWCDVTSYYTCAGHEVTYNPLS